MADSTKLLGSLVLWIALIVSFGLQIMMLAPVMLGVSTTPFSIFMRAGMAILSVILIGLAFLKIERIGISKLSLLLLVFWMIYIVRLVYDLDVAHVEYWEELPSKASIYMFAIGGCFIPVVAIAIWGKNMPLNQIIPRIFLIVAMQNLAILFIHHWLFGLSMDFFYSRYLLLSAMVSETGARPINPILTGRAGGYLAVFSVAYLLFFHRPKKWMTTMALAMIGLGLINLALSGSRGPTVAFVFVIASMLSVYFLKKPIRTVVMLVGFSLVVLLAGVISKNEGVEIENLDSIRRLSEFADSANGNRHEERYYLWHSAWNQFLNHPIVGDQFVSRFKGVYPHNVILEAFMATGLLGSIFFIALLVGTIVKGFMAKKRNTVLYIVFWSYLFILICNLFSGALFLSTDMWMQIALISALPTRG
jgi:O-antigen ligase